MKAKHFVLYVLLFLITSVSTYSNSDFAGEIVVVITDNSTRQIDLNAVGIVWGDHTTNYAITNSYNSYSTTYSSAAYDFCESQDNDLPVVGYGLYKITIDTAYFIYVDERDCDWNNRTLYSDPDITFNFDPSSHTWTAYGSGYNGSVGSGSTFNIWTLKTSPQTPATSTFQPTDPSGLSITNVGGHPSLTWSASSDPSSAKYHVYRNGTQITSSALTSPDYVDDDIDMGSHPPTFAYKVRAVSGDGTTSSSVNYTNEVTVHGIEVEKKPGVAIEVPLENKLDQNYPNPFNPATTISYQILKDGRVTIKVFDAIGREVTTLVDEFKPSGQYSIKFDASRLSSGIYIYSVKSGDYNAVKKMALIK